MLRNVRNGAAGSPAPFRPNYGIATETELKSELTLEPASRMAATQRIEIRPASSAYSIRSWPCSSRISESAKIFMFGFSLMRRSLTHVNDAVPENQQVDCHSAGSADLKNIRD